MKYLKKFNESKTDSQFHMDQIKDIFQEYIDEYEIDMEPDIEKGTSGIYYCMVIGGRSPDPDTQFSRILPSNFLFNDENFLYIWVNFYRQGDYVNSLITQKNSLLYDKFSLLKKDLEGFDSRLKNMGYDFSLRWKRNMTYSQTIENHGMQYKFPTEYKNDISWIITEYKFNLQSTEIASGEKTSQL